MNATTFYQVRVGNHTQWITTEKWQRQMKENEINKILLGGTNYGSRYNQIESVTILPLSNFPSSKKCHGKTRKD